jgi:hypothetical protein
MSRSEADKAKCDANKALAAEVRSPGSLSRAGVLEANRCAREEAKEKGAASPKPTPKPTPEPSPKPGNK